MAPSLKLRDREHLALLADEELGAAAADVDEQEPLVEDRHGLEHAEVDEAGLLDAGDDLDVDRRPRRWARWTKSSWFSASRTALVATARDGGAVATSATCRMRSSAAMPRSIASGVSTFMSPPPEPRRTDLLLAGDDLEAIVGVEPGNDEMDRVGADVDRRERRVGRGAASSVAKPLVTVPTLRCGPWSQRSC